MVIRSEQTGDSVPASARRTGYLHRSYVRVRVRMRQFNMRWFRWWSANDRGWVNVY